MSLFPDKFSILYDKVLPYLEVGESYCLGFSGGRDSIALLKVLCELRNIINFNLTALHVNHKLRKEEADEDRAYCENICKEWNVAFEFTTVDVKKFAAQNSLSEEEAARERRFEWFGKILKEKNCGKIFLAHHADDQAETLLFRLFRGAGLRGLGGMSPVSKMMDFEIIRPWLDIRQNLINEFREFRKIQCRYDSSNDSIKYKRNWIRHVLIPELQKEFYHDLENKLVQTAEICRNSNDFISLTAYEALSSNSIESILGMIFPVRVFENLHTAIQRALVIEMFKKQDCLINFENVEAVRNFILSERKNLNIQFPGGIFSGKSWRHFYLGCKKPELTGFNVEILECDRFVKEKCRSDNGEAWEKLALGQKAEMTQFASLDSTSGITIRGWEAGDYYRPVNGPRKKIKNLFIDAGIPKELKSAIPVVEKNGEIIWVAGWRISENFKVKPGEKVFRLDIRLNVLSDDGH